jgi:hypothetical protein
MCFFVADFSELCRRIDGRPPRSRPVQLRCSKPSSLARQDHVENASAGQSGQCMRSSPRAGVSRACPAVPIADAGPRARVTPAEHQAAKLLTEPSTACHSAARGGPSVRPRGRPQPIKDEIRTSPECLQPLAYVQGSGVPPLPPPSRSLLSPKQAAPPSTEAYSVVAPRSRE